jgi:predicted DNA-binding protein YlxM (UPF0122 family)
MGTWSKADETRLIKLYKKNSKIEDLAIEFNRSYAATKKKIYTLIEVRQRKKSFKWTDSLKEEAINLYVNKEWTLQQIADYLECSLGAIQNLVNNFGVMRKKKVNLTLQNKKDIRDCYFKGVTLHLISKKIGRDEEIIRKYINKKKWNRGSLSYEIGFTNRRNNTISKYLKFDFKTKADYVFAVRKLVRPIWDLYSDIIDPDATRLILGYTIDHKVSIDYGWKNQVPLRIISHPANLQMLSSIRNATKGSKNSIPLSVLEKDIIEFDKTYNPSF